MIIILASSQRRSWSGSSAFPTNPRDIVLGALSGTGTTVVVAARLGRRYVAIDIDEEYVRITREKVAAVGRGGYVRRGNGRKTQRAHTKKELQLEPRALAARLGRLPTPDDVEKMSPYEVKILLDMFPTWGKALNAAKMENSVCVLPSGEVFATIAATERTERL